MQGRSGAGVTDDRHFPSQGQQLMGSALECWQLLTSMVTSCKYVPTRASSTLHWISTRNRNMLVLCESTLNRARIVNSDDWKNGWVCSFMEHERTQKVTLFAFHCVNTTQ